MGNVEARIPQADHHANRENLRQEQANGLFPRLGMLTSDYESNGSAWGFRDFVTRRLVCRGERNVPGAQF